MWGFFYGCGLQIVNVYEGIVQCVGVVFFQVFFYVGGLVVVLFKYCGEVQVVDQFEQMFFLYLEGMIVFIGCLVQFFVFFVGCVGMEFVVLVVVEVFIDLYGGEVVIFYVIFQ